MQAKVSGENPFKCFKSTFAIGPTSAGYTLNYAVLKEGPYTAWEKATPANETCMVNHATPFCWFKLVGNADADIDIIL